MGALNYLRRVKKDKLKKEARGIAYAIGSGLLFLGVCFFFKFFGLENLFLLAPLAVAISSYVGGLHLGIITLGIVTSGIVYIYPGISLFSALTVVIESILISFIVEKSQKIDISLEYKKREKDYQKLVSQLYDEKEKALQEIKARDEFLSIASHELKTPLTTMLSQTQVALHNIRNVSLANFSVENLLKMLESAESQTQRLSKMINDLLNVSLITTGRMDLEKEDMELTSTIKEVLDRFSAKIEKENLKINYHPEREIRGEWDKLRIEQVVTNLLTNAIKYGQTKPIEVEVSNSNGSAKIKVVDQGIGIPKEMQSKIFSRFGRAVESKHYDGLGVGLYITSQIVKAHGGKISVDSSSGRGSTFLVELPLKNNTQVQVNTVVQ